MKEEGVKKVNMSILETEIDLITSIKNDFAIFEIPILKKWAGKSISEIDVRKTYHINVLAIKKGGNLKVLPEANYVFDQSDHIIVIGKPADVFKLTNRT